MSRNSRYKKSSRNPRGNPNYETPRNFKNYIKFMMIAIILMVMMDQFVFQGERPHIRKMKEDYRAEQARKAAIIEDLLPPVVDFSDEGAMNILEDNLSTVSPASGLSLVPKSVNGLPASIKPPKTPPKTPPKNQTIQKVEGAKIAIVFGVVGVSRKQSLRVMDLPEPMTLAFLPYADGVREMAAKASSKNHELIIHTPMEAMRSDVPLGGMALTVGMNGLDFSKEFNRMVQAFDGYVGVNNHMGSRLTQDKRSMVLLMAHLKQRGLYFLDSKTIGSSVAAKTAAQAGLRYAERDVFLDHEETPEFVAHALRNVERIAREQGSVIAIGHPKSVTINALKAWMPKAKAAGYEFVFVSQVLSN